MSTSKSLSTLAEELRELHSGPVLVLPNTWDAASSRVVEEAGFPAVATASAAVSAVLGHPDGEAAPWQEMFAANARIARSVSVPVTMDAEGGYGMAAQELVDRLLETGVVGCNLEDTDHRSGGLKDAEGHAAWLAAVRAAATASGVALVLNARIDVFLGSSGVPEPDRLREAQRRARLYRDAGADCVYPIGVGDAATLTALLEGLDAPVNANTSQHLDLRMLGELGVARVSYGPRFFRAALADFDTRVRELVPG